jgi:hypothetical protein
MTTRVVGGVLAVWLAAVTLFAYEGWFVTNPGQPALALLAAVVLPVFLFAVAYWQFEGFRRYVRAGDPQFLTNLQSWRVLGGVFLVLLSFGLLPAAFAWPAGLGDVAIGLTAPFIAWSLTRQGRFQAGRLFSVWQFLGVLDLVVAIGVGASIRQFPEAMGASNSELMVVMSQLPLSLIPTFAVPLFLILHLAGFAQVRARLRAGSEPGQALVGV